MKYKIGHLIYLKQSAFGFALDDWQLGPYLVLYTNKLYIDEYCCLSGDYLLIFFRTDEIDCRHNGLS